MIAQTISQQLLAFLPEIVLVATFCLLVLGGLIVRKKETLMSILAFVGVALSAVFALCQSGRTELLFSGMIAVDSFAVFMKVFLASGVLFIILISHFSAEVRQTVKRISEYYSLLVALTLGTYLMAGATHLLMMVLAMEITSLSAYVLAGYTKEATDSSEASLKYILYGAVASGIMLYGISLLFGMTGVLHYGALNHVLAVEQINTVALTLAVVFVMAGFAYKISAVPFHAWTPDVYEGAPITVTTLLAVVSKAAGFAMLLRFFRVVFVDPYAVTFSGNWASLTQVDWQMLLAILSALTMTLGNLVALWQDNLKRLLAYSSIAHAGYMLMGVVVLTDKGITAILVYLVMYLFMNMGAFFVVMLVANKTGREDIDSYKGLGSRAPLLATAMAVFLVSLTGIPPTAGFIGKFYLFAAVLDARWFWLALAGVLNSVISLYYYARVIRNMFLRETEGQMVPLALRRSEALLLLAFLLPTLVAGVYFTPIVELAQASLIMAGMR